jgi:hypothetical protein
MTSKLGQAETIQGGKVGISQILLEVQEIYYMDVTMQSTLFSCTMAM